MFPQHPGMALHVKTSLACGDALASNINTEAAKQHGGSIEVDTQPGEYAEIRVILPRTSSM